MASVTARATSSTSSSANASSSRRSAKSKRSSAARLVASANASATPRLVTDSSTGSTAPGTRNEREAHGPGMTIPTAASRWSRRRRAIFCDCRPSHDAVARRVAFCLSSPPPSPSAPSDSVPFLRRRRARVSAAASARGASPGCLPRSSPRISAAITRASDTDTVPGSSLGRIRARASATVASSASAGNAAAASRAVAQSRGTTHAAIKYVASWNASRIERASMPCVSRNVSAAPHSDVPRTKLHVPPAPCASS